MGIGTKSVMTMVFLKLLQNHIPHGRTTWRLTAKEAIQHLMQQMHTPKALWNYCASGGCTPHEIITGNTPDVTQFVEFG